MLEENTKSPRLIEYLRSVAKLRRAIIDNGFAPQEGSLSPEEYCLKYAKSYEPAIKIADNKSKYGSGIKKHCYGNSMRLVKRYPNLRYVEGYALTTFGFPVEHGWAVDGEDQVIEITWPENGREYFGVELPIPFVESYAKVFRSLSIFQDWPNAYLINEINVDKLFELDKEKTLELVKSWER